MIDLTKPVQTRDGRQARVVATDLHGRPQYKVLALVTKRDGTSEVPASYTLSGQYYDDGSEDGWDLVQAPYVPAILQGENTFYVNVGATYGNPAAASGAYPSYPVIGVTIIDGTVHKTEIIPASKGEDSE